MKSRVAGVANGEAFSRAVARYLFKLMAYKDEYEVARLYADGDFKKKVAAEFSGDYRLKFHMAPPVFNRSVDELGRPLKSDFGPWMYGALAVLKNFRFLRGTAFDPFGASEERRLERRLIADYRSRIDDISSRLNAANIAVATEIASLPDDIRGYGPVKLAAIEKAEQRFSSLMKAFNEGRAEIAA